MSSRTAAPASVRGWPAVVCVTVGIFAIVTTEILPIGLLTEIAAGFGRSAGQAGLTMTAPGLVAAVSAPVVAVAAGRTDRRTLLTVFAALLTAANVIAALAPTYPVVLVARILVGVTIGGFWSVAAGLAGRLVPPRSARRATAVIFAAVPLGSVLGVPAGTLIGDLAGWRAAFWVLAALSAAVTVAVLATVPPLPADQAVRPSELRAALASTDVVASLVVTFLIVLAHFGAYTYVRPFLETVTGSTPLAVTALLFAYGAAGVVGNFIGGLLVAARPHAVLGTAAALLAAATMLLPVFGRGELGSAVLLVAWGIAYGAVPVCSQTWFARSVRQGPEVSSVLFTASFQATLALGALIGGQLVDRSTPSGVLVTGGSIAASVVAVVLLHHRRSGFVSV